LADDSTAANYWSTDKEGGMMTAGVGGPITGKGCVTGDTVIYTNAGAMTVKDYFQKYSLKDNILCLSYDHSCDSIVFNKIIARRELTSREIYEVHTNQGNKLRLTGEHPIYDRERGYTKARDLLPGNGILGIKEIAKEQNLRDLRETQNNQGPIASGVLFQSKKDRIYACVHSMWQDIRAITVRLRKGIEPWLQRCLLLKKMQPGASCREELASISLQSLWNGNQTRAAVLFSGMQTSIFGRATQETERQNLSGVSRHLHADIQPNDILRSNLQKFRTLITNAWRRQLPLQDRHELCEAFSGNAPVNPGKGWMHLRTMRGAGNHDRDTAPDNPRAVQSYNSPHRYRPKKQFTRKSGDSLRNMPCDSPSLFRDTIQAITNDCSEEYVVYDIEVEGTHNYFANNICVKNCDLGIIDDPHKNWQEAQSQSTRKGIQEWFDSTFYTRAEPGATIIVLATRWNEDDLIGYLTTERAADGWFHIVMPAIAEENDILGRLEGEALCPERYDIDALVRIKANMTAMMWAALFQQRPAPAEGTIFLRERWKFYDRKPVFSFVLQSWDTATKKNYDAAFSVCQTWGISPFGVYLIDQFRERVQYPQLRKAVDMQYYKYRPNVILIEDRDSGQALIQSLQQETSYPVIPVYPDMDKLIRAQAVSPWQVSGRLWLPTPSQASWIGDFVESCAAFPNTKFMDEVDAMSQAIAYVMTMAIGGRVHGDRKRVTSKLLEGFREMM